LDFGGRVPNFGFRGSDLVPGNLNESVEDLLEVGRVHLSGFGFRVHTAGYEGTFWSDSDQLSVTLSVGTPIYPYGIAYRRAYGLSTAGLFKKPLSSPLCGSQKMRV